MRNKKDLLARALGLTGVGSLIRAVRPWSGLLVLNYHRIGDAASSPLDSGVYSATQDQFDEQLSWLKTHADVIGAPELDAAFRDVRGQFVLITFDDGYRDNYELAFPVLQRHGVPATFFITTGFVDQRQVAWWDEIAWMVKHANRFDWPERLRASREPWTVEDGSRVIRTLLQAYKALPTDAGPAFLEEIAAATGSGRCPLQGDAAPWMTWGEIRRLRDEGHAIGAHTVTHPLLARCSSLEQRHEICESKRRLEEVLSTSVDTFSYPVGTADAFTAETIDLIRQAGFRWAFNFQGGCLTSTSARTANRFSLPRVAMEPELTQPRFHAMATLPALFA
jgi:peptidoglycan/xylan/chitin deacetylase (PgdA/CDA1 family)